MPTDLPHENKLEQTGEYGRLLSEIKVRVRSAQYEALKAVNKKLVGLYWDIGRMIVERQETEGWGKSVVERLSADLRQEFPAVSGFSAQNLWYMRQFYSEYHDNERLQPLVGEIAWAHNLVIMSKCKDPLEREFYIRMTRKFGWSKNVLIHPIDNQSYEKSLSGQTNFDQALTPELRAQAKLAVRDEYTLIFWSWVKNTANGSWNGRSSPGSRIFCGAWAACSPSWAVSTGWRWMEKNFSSIFFFFTAACVVLWLLS